MAEKTRSTAGKTNRHRLRTGDFDFRLAEKEIRDGMCFFEFSEVVVSEFRKIQKEKIRR